MARRVRARLPVYDKGGEEHYDVVSAFIKSLRGSDPDAALYWLARMLEGGEEPRFIARRLVIFASEDVGNADPPGLAVATAAAQAVERIGMPEGAASCRQATTYLACAPKSNASLPAIDRACRGGARERGSLPVPLHLRNAPTELLQRARLRQGLPLPARRPRVTSCASSICPTRSATRLLRALGPGRGAGDRRAAARALAGRREA